MRPLAVLILACVPCLVVAQAKPENRAEIEVVQEAGAKALKISAPGKFGMSELVRLYADCRGAVALLNSNALVDFEVAGEVSGKTFRGEALDLFVQSALETARVGFRIGDGGVLVIKPLVEMAAHSNHLTEDELGKANPAHWATFVFNSRHTDPNALRASLQNLMSRHGGLVLPVTPSALIIVERVDRLRQVLKAARAIDAASAQHLKTYVLPEGTDADAAEKALRDLFTDPKDARSARVTVVASTRKILVLAKEDVQAQVVEAIKQLK